MLAADVVELRGAEVLFRKGAHTVAHRLAVFPPAEQTRLKAAVGIVDIPEGLKDARTLVQRTLQRLRLLHEGGQLSDEAYSIECVRARAVFREQAAPYVLKGLLSDRQVSQLVP